LERSQPAAEFAAKAASRRFGKLSSHRFPAKHSITSKTLLSLPQLLEGQQGDFARTGGIHAAGIFDLDGASKVVRETSAA